MQLAGGIIELLCRQNPEDRTNLGLNHICFLTDDLDGDYEALAAAGTRIGRITMVKDPNGAKIEFVDRKALNELQL